MTLFRRSFDALTTHSDRSFSAHFWLFYLNIDGQRVTNEVFVPNLSYFDALSTLSERSSSAHLWLFYLKYFLNQLQELILYIIPTKCLNRSIFFSIYVDFYCIRLFYCMTFTDIVKQYICNDCVVLEYNHIGYSTVISHFSMNFW